MLLAVDVGNTNTVMGLYRDRELVQHWRTRTDRDLTADQQAVALDGLFRLRGVLFGDVSDVIVSSVVPPLNSAIADMCRRYLHIDPLFVGPGIRTGIDLRVEEPRAVGADRIVNAVAAYDRHRQAVIVVDFGTATTFDVVSDDGEFLGGAIAPGIMISTEALFRAAAALPRIDIVRPKSAIGRNTVTNMQAGIVFGVAGQVDAIVRRIQRELGRRTPVIATGGLASLVAEECETITEVDPFLTLTGLRIIYERNRPARAAVDPERAGA